VKERGGAGGRRIRVRDHNGQSRLEWSMTDGQPKGSQPAGINPSPPICQTHSEPYRIHSTRPRAVPEARLSQSGHTRKKETSGNKESGVPVAQGKGGTRSKSESGKKALSVSRDSSNCNRPANWRQSDAMHMHEPVHSSSGSDYDCQPVRRGVQRSGKCLTSP
jgi:hypothetical protein